MKFRIKKVEDLNENTIDYAPECKLHWYTSWKSIVPGYYRPYVLTTSITKSVSSLKKAKNIIKIYKKYSSNKPLVTTYIKYAI